MSRRIFIMLIIFLSLLSLGVVLFLVFSLNGMSSDYSAPARYRQNFPMKKPRRNIRQYTMVAALLTIWIIFSVMTALSGIVFTARLNAATATAGTNFELDAIAAVVIGGTSLAGGVGTIAGALIGALVMSSLDNGMSLLDMDVTWQYILKGLILVAAVWVDTATQKKSRL